MMNNFQKAFASHDMGASFTTESMPLNTSLVAAVAAKWTGSPVGTVVLQVSNDDSHWSDYTGSSVDISAAGDILWNLQNVGYAHVRVKYTRTSGTGTFTGSVNGKGVS